MNGYPVAFCAPGRRADAAATLAIKGERVEAIVEHPYLAGASEVIVVAEPPDLSDPMEAFRISLPESIR